MFIIYLLFIYLFTDNICLFIYIFIGIYHSGVEICGKEYCFGGHEYKNITGVFAVEAKSGPPGLIFKYEIDKEKEEKINKST